MICSKTRIDVAQMSEAAQHETGADKQHYRQRDLDDYERLAQASATAGGAATSFFKRIGEFHPRSPNRRHQSEYDARQQRDNAGERQHTPVKTYLACARKRVRTECYE